MIDARTVRRNTKITKGNQHDPDDGPEHAWIDFPMKTELSLATRRS